MESIEKSVSDDKAFLGQPSAPKSGLSVDKMHLEAGIVHIDGPTHGSSVKSDLLKGLPFSKPELAQILSEFLLRHNITRKAMSQRHVDMFKATVRHAATMRVSVCDPPCENLESASDIVQIPQWVYDM